MKNKLNLVILFFAIFMMSGFLVNAQETPEPEATEVVVVEEELNEMDDVDLFFSAWDLVQFIVASFVGGVGFTVGIGYAAYKIMQNPEHLGTAEKLADRLFESVPPGVVEQINKVSDSAVQLALLMSELTDKEPASEKEEKVTVEFEIDEDAKS